MLANSDEQYYNLQPLTNFLQEMTGATGVYVGQQRAHYRQIEEDDDDRAHIGEETPKLVWHLFQSADHEFMFEKALNEDQGVTHDAFKEKEEAVPVDDEQLDEENKQALAKSDDILDTETYVFVPEVVREPRMHFYKVPRLGCYMAVPLVYSSCLTEEALDAAIADYFEVKRQQMEQDKLRLEWEEE